MLRSRGRQRPSWLVEGGLVGANLIYFPGVRGAIAQSSAVISRSQAYVRHSQSGTLACSRILALCYRPALGHIRAVAAVRRRRKALLSALTSKHSATPYTRHPSYPSGHYSNGHIDHITLKLLAITKAGGARHAQCLTKLSRASVSACSSGHPRRCRSGVPMVRESVDYIEACPSFHPILRCPACHAVASPACRPISSWQSAVAGPRRRWQRGDERLHAQSSTSPSGPCAKDCCIVQRYELHRLGGYAVEDGKMKTSGLAGFWRRSVWPCCRDVASASNHVLKDTISHSSRHPRRRYAAPHGYACKSLTISIQHYVIVQW